MVAGKFFNESITFPTPTASSLLVLLKVTGYVMGPGAVGLVIVKFNAVTVSKFLTVSKSNAPPGIMT